MNRIAIFLPDLRAGGAERLHVNLSRQWIDRGIGVDFVLRQARGELMGQLPAQARVIDLDAPRLRNTFTSLRTYLQNHRPQALLAAMWPLTFIAPVAVRLAGYRGRVVISEHAPISMAYVGRGALHNLVMKATMRVGYRLAHSRVGVSSGVADDMARLSGISRSAITVIHNPAATGRAAGICHPRPPLLEGQAGPVVLSVGTLKGVKRHDLLIRAFAQMQTPGAMLVILGEGPERTSLEALVESLGLQGRVKLPGYQPDPAAWYAHADQFVLSSDHEGFGNVIVEALEHGVPVVSTDCPFGPREILEDGKYGALVPVGDVDALARAMDDALSRAHDSEALKRRARDFGVDKASAAYLDLLLPGRRAI